jgi:hypothetical protein
MRASQRGRVLELLGRRQPLGAAPRGVDGARAGLALDRGDERLAHLVLAELGLEADELVEEPGGATGVAPRFEDAGHAGLAAHVARTELVHHAVPVALEQRHERLHPADRAAVLGRGEQGRRGRRRRAGSGPAASPRARCAPR